MKFSVLSSILNSKLQILGKVITNKPKVPILTHFLLDIGKENLIITATDMEKTIIASMPIDNDIKEDDNYCCGSVCVESKLLIDILHNFNEEVLIFEADSQSHQFDIRSDSGVYSLRCTEGENFPVMAPIDDAAKEIAIPTDILSDAIDKTVFAATTDDLRPALCGIFVDIADDGITFVGTDSHKMSVYKRKDIVSSLKGSFIIPKKGATLLKSVLIKSEADTKFKFNNNFALFELEEYKIGIRLIDAQFPAYQTVIPQNNDNKLIIKRESFIKSIKRVSVFGEKTSNLIKFDLKPNKLTITAQDLNFNVSGTEHIECKYDGNDLTIGFKAAFLLEMLISLNSDEIIISFSDNSGAILIGQTENKNVLESIVMLLMPMMINN